MTNEYKYVAKNDGIYKMNDNEKVSIEEMSEVIIDIVSENIKENQPHIFVYEETPFISQYTGRMSIDYSGRVKLAEREDILELGNELKDLNLGEYKNFYKSKLAKLLDNLRTGQSVATYTSNLGLHWTTYIDQIEEDIQYWVFQNTFLPDEDDPNYDEAIDMLIDFTTDLNSLLQEILKTMDYEETLNEIIELTAK